MSRLIFTSLDQSVPLAAAVFDQDTHGLLPCGGFACVDDFEGFVKEDLRSRGLCLGKVVSAAEGIATLSALNDEGRSVRQYLVVTTQQLTSGWLNQVSADDPPVAAFGLERGQEGGLTGAYPVGTFLSSAAMKEHRDFSENAIKGFDAEETFALVVPYLLTP